MPERRLRLSADRVREIRRLATRCLRQIGCTAPKVPVDDIARLLGAEVIYAPNTEDEVAGMLIYRRSRPVVVVNSSHHPNRQRFTLAHECGHLLLKHLQEGHVDRHFVINRDERSSEGTNVFEVEANQFAAELLMPLRFLIRDLRDQDFDLESDQQVQDLAKAYGVSSSAMSYRVAKIFM